MDDNPNLLPRAKPMRELQRQRYKVELKPDEINFVSSKKLTKEKAQEPSQSEKKPHNDNTEKKPQPDNISRNYFSAVLERMENIYRGVDSSDDEEDNVGEGGATGAMDYCDCDDSFIDDSELNEYCKVVKTKSKYRGSHRERRRTQRKIKSPVALLLVYHQKKKRKKISLDEIQKKRPKKRVSRMQISSPANEAMDKVVGRDMDKVDDTKISKELGSTSTGVLGSDECKEVGNVRKKTKNYMEEIPKKDQRRG
ncbi:hypothetical protein SUGI_0208050 [Cryptomeria japonica]|nr:hypothetical protein SUGI_0208050 [Cryptomeria japonica]